MKGESKWINVVEIVNGILKANVIVLI